MKAKKPSHISLLVLIGFIISFIAFSTSSVDNLYATGGEVVLGERPFIDIYEVSDEAMEENHLLIKFREERTDHLDNTEIITDENGIIVFGLPEIDTLNQLYNVHTAIPIFGSNALQNGYEWRHRLWGFHLWYELLFDSEEDIRDIIMEYRSIEDVLSWAEPRYHKTLFDDNSIRWSPDDPLLDNQWHYHNTGQAGGTPGADISLFEAWDIEKGHPDVIVAVIDTGIDYNHEDLSDNMWPGIGYNFFDDIPDINPGNHGTHIAGTIAAVNNNSIGVAGIAGGSGAQEGVRLMSCQIGPPSGITLSFAAPAMVFAADNGAAISQNSWGNTQGYNQDVLDAIDYFNSNGGGAVMNGGITIFAAGNYGTNNPVYPAYYGSTLAVAATNNQDIKAGYSTYGEWIDISAPGGEINNPPPANIYRGVLSTVIDNQYGYYNGTSMACPHVSGVAALVLSFAYRNGTILDNSQLIEVLRNSTDNHYDINPEFADPQELGTGRLNAYKALLEFPDYLFPGGNGTEEDPWWIETDQHLKYVRHFLGLSHRDKCFIQIGDIDLDVSPWNANEGWIPIGTTGLPFCGRYDGNGYKIKNLFIDSNAEYIGLFGYLRNAEVINVAVIDAEITGTGTIGGLAGRNRYRQIEEDEDSTPDVDRRAYSRITNCYTTGNITSLNISSGTGGLVGINDDGAIQNSFSSVNVTGDSSLGGLVGKNFGGLLGGGSIRNSFSTGSVIGANEIGGLVGRNHTLEFIYRCYSSGYVYGSGVSIGGLIGLNQGPVGYSYWDVWSSNQETSHGGVGRTTLEMLQEDYFENWDFTQTWEIVDFNSVIRKHYPILRWQEDYPHNKITNAHAHRYEEQEWYWRCFPRLEYQDDFTYTVELLSQLEDIVTGVMEIDDESGYTRFMEWHPDYGWQGDEIAFNGAKGYKLQFSNHEENFLFVKADRIALDHILTLYPSQGGQVRENWIGYFVPQTQCVFDAFGLEVMNQLEFIESDTWSMHKMDAGNGEFIWTFDPEHERPFLEYGRMYSVVTDSEELITFTWNLPLEPEPYAGRMNIPKAEFFEYSETSDYESFFVEDIEEDGDVLEVAVFAGQTCVGASVFLGGYPLEILAYTNASHAGEEISFAIHRDGQRGEPEIIRVPQVMNNATGEYTSRILRPRRQRYTVVRLSAGDEESESLARPEIILSQNHPNPVFYRSASRSALTSIPFYIAEDREVTLTIYNIRGQRVKTLFSGTAAAGKHSVAWNGLNDHNRMVGSGVYFFRLESGDKTITRKMLIIR